MFAECARILLEDANVDGLLITGLYGGYGVRFSHTLVPIEMEASDRIAELHRQLAKPVLVHSLYGSLYADLRPAPLTRLRETGIPVYDSVELAVRCIQALAEHGEARSRAPLLSDAHAPRGASFARTLAACHREHRTVVLESEAREALVAAGVDMPPSRVALAADEAAAAFVALGRRPIAIKILSRDIIHKSDAGGVALDVAGEDAARQAFERIVANARRYRPSADDARSMLEDIRAREILNGVRGAPPTDKAALVRVMLSISALCSAFPEIAELDLNPVLVYPQGVRMLDARFLLEDERRRAACKPLERRAPRRDNGRPQESTMTKHVKIGAVSYVDEQGRRVRIPASEGRVTEQSGSSTTLLWWDDDGTEHRTPLTPEEYTQYRKSGQIVEIERTERRA